jgi:hypothetical protein
MILDDQAAVDSLGAGGVVERAEDVFACGGVHRGMFWKQSLFAVSHDAKTIRAVREGVDQDRAV